jgi:Holliday junction resolvase RusA-like endonuclease
MSTYTVWVPGTPVPKARPRVVVRNGKAHAYTDAHTVAWEQAIALAWRQTYPGFEPLAGPLEVEVFVYMRDPNKGDGDNLFKCVGDALNEVAWVDDSRIMRAIVEKRRAGDYCEQGTGILVIVREREATNGH